MSEDTPGGAPAPRAAGRRRPEAASSDGFNERLAALVTRSVGNMWVVYGTVVFVLLWIALGVFGPLRSVDPYPFAFLLFMGNVIQLLLVFVILVGQGVLGRSADQRAEQTYNDAEALLHEIGRLHDHLAEQDRVLNQGIELVEPRRHPRIEERRFDAPVRVEEQFIGLNGRIAAWITRGVSTMWAFYAATLFQFGWMGLALVGVIRFDPFPFAFLLFISSLLQLVFMFVIMVGQDVLGRAGDRRSHQTYLDAEAALHECERLQEHLTAQDRLIVGICEFIAQNAPADHPVRRVVPTASSLPALKLDGPAAHRPAS